MHLAGRLASAIAVLWFLHGCAFVAGEGRHQPVESGALTTSSGCSGWVIEDYEPEPIYRSPEAALKGAIDREPQGAAASFDDYVLDSSGESDVVYEYRIDGQLDHRWEIYRYRDGWVVGARAGSRSYGCASPEPLR